MPKFTFYIKKCDLKSGYNIQKTIKQTDIGKTEGPIDFLVIFFLHFPNYERSHRQTEKVKTEDLFFYWFFFCSLYYV